MSKTPEEYFQEQSFSVPGRSGGSEGGFSAAELTFIRKYMGLDAPDTLRKMGLGAKAAELEQEPEILELPPQPVPAVVTGLLGDADSPVPPLQQSKTPSAGQERSASHAEPAGTPMDSLQMSLDRNMPEKSRQAGEAVAAVLTDVVPSPGEAALGKDEAAPVKVEAATAPVEEVVDSTALALEDVPAVEPATAQQVTVQMDELTVEPMPEIAPAAPEAAALDMQSLETDFEQPVSETAQPLDEITVEPAAAPEAEASVAATAEPAPVVAESAFDAVEASAEATPQSEVASLSEAAPTVEAVPAAAPVAAVAAPHFNIADNYDDDLLDNSDLATYRETTRQQFQTIRMALEALSKDGDDIQLADAIYRSLVTVQNSSNYMGLDEIKVYAERTAGIVDQGRKSGIDFGLMVDLISQESGILSDMVEQAIEKLAAMPEQGEETGQSVEAAQAATPAEAAAPASAPTPQSVPAQAAAAVPAESVEPVTPVAPSAVSVQAETAEASEIVELTAGSAGEAAPASAVEEKEAAPKETARPVDKETGKRRTASIAEIYEGMDIQEALDHYLRHEPELQMVAFYLGSQEFTVPTVIVQEVIHYSEPAKLPVAPPFVAGVINLRGKVTPLVYLRDILEVKQERKTEDCFIIICRFQGLQVGLIIERVHTMYRVPQSDIDWGIEQHLGINVDYVSGLLKLNDNLVGIVSVDRIVTNLLQDL